jgi:hypothetical protein
MLLARQISTIMGRGVVVRIGAGDKYKFVYNIIAGYNIAAFVWSVVGFILAT